MRNKDQTPAAISRDVDNFLAKVAAAPVPVKGKEKGRLIFAMDATASREPTWDRACHLQGEMFKATDSLGGLTVQLCYYRGFNEFHSSRWCEHTRQLLTEMSGTTCLGGHTQIRKVLAHLETENSLQKVQAAVFVGDAVEENADDLCQRAGKLGVLGVPLFMFHEGNNASAASVFRQMAHLSGGAYAPFNPASATQLRDLLAAVAIFVAGGHRALQDLGKDLTPEVSRLLQQLKE
ncbi:MAG: hypothetical protein CMQ20_15365 [Gammaproteobacteria bacterium]|jgi:hypothetical protein|nr:hypothetical protein [Gammaproteobacteria bacterium]|tara:strand:- start:4130 stop:4834 length:705 start_codon:yes stop_codon:yes gene_type:complete